MCYCVLVTLRPGSVVEIATGYGMNGQESNPCGGEIFRTCPDRPWGPPSLLYNGYRVLPGSKERPGRDADPSPTSSTFGHERVELYLYSPYGPYGLYRASVPVQGWPLPFTLYLSHTTMTVNSISIQNTTCFCAVLPICATQTHTQSHKHCVDFAHYFQHTSDKVFEPQQKFLTAQFWFKISLSFTACGITSLDGVPLTPT
jgi:hypothetical protein